MAVSVAKVLAMALCLEFLMLLSVIQAACQVSKRLASIFLAMSASMKLMAWLAKMGAPNWMRVLA